ncbi:uncharacterized protein TrAFT101_007634 [Trichoderma asperellum]|uniref:Uncharacterized protein n=1 Tax=Trichoderma asperellum (strain ATCC 204424 / CBS 433.97 / NBRC 101777) TaxID=1042311 RepID=A0A2T3Z466_TRIA4|nr:hypothetical protein M441DRAFT_440621 [Trichoderma asperellum CBS 433.97]PTB39589.1 hypothetical protein M441DRAFT_440621 [Trichoderma asperellum CBS 433.97]UKZ92692.1 hypothetical protein TrAFT101_007634 [Trichoderma asperellum]
MTRICTSPVPTKGRTVSSPWTRASHLSSRVSPPLVRRPSGARSRSQKHRVFGQRDALGALVLTALLTQSSDRRHLQGPALGSYQQETTLKQGLRLATCL